MDTIPRQGPFWLAMCSGLLLLPTALWEASGALSGPMGVITFLRLLPLALVVIVLIGAWATRTAPQPGLWGKIILGSSFVQFFLSLFVAVWPIAVVLQIPELVLLGAVLLGVICGMMSGIWLIAEHSGSSTQA